MKAYLGQQVAFDSVGEAKRDLRFKHSYQELDLWQTNVERDSVSKKAPLTRLLDVCRQSS